MPKGGERKGAGRPKGEPTTTIRVPVALKPSILDTVKQWLSDKTNNDKKESGK